MLHDYCLLVKPQKCLRGDPDCSPTEGDEITTGARCRRMRVTVKEIEVQQNGDAISHMTEGWCTADRTNRAVMPKM